MQIKPKTTHSRYRDQQGFTLIELIMVIVILGILSAFALPRFADFSSNARTATLEQLGGILQTGASLVYAQAYIQGITDTRGQWIDIDSDGSNDIRLHAGYPGVMNSCTQFVSGLEHWIESDIPTSCTSNSAGEGDWYGVLDWNQFHFMPAGYTSTAENCYVTYREATSGSPGSSSSETEILISVVDSGC